MMKEWLLVKTIDLIKGRSFYMFTDGYADQFGGENCKKFGYKKIKEILVKNNSNSMNKQKVVIEKELIDWMGKNDQIDDILFVGFRIN